MQTTTQTVILNVSPNVRCFRLVHNATGILSYFVSSGVTQTANVLFCGTDAECQDEMTRLGFPPVAAPYQAVRDAPRRAITRFAFWCRFTSAEQLAISNSADNAVNTFLTGLALAQDVDLDLPMLSQALDYATSINLLAEGRKAEILA